MRNVFKEIGKNILLISLYIAGTLTFIFIIGEPQETTPIHQWLFIKIGAFISAYLMTKLCPYLSRKGYLPEWHEDYIESNENGKEE